MKKETHKEHPKNIHVWVVGRMLQCRTVYPSLSFGIVLVAVVQGCGKCYKVDIWQGPGGCESLSGVQKQGFRK